MRRARLERLGWLVVLGLALASWYATGAASGSSPSFLVRSIGPFARPAARVQWVRVDAAIRAGRTDLALARADTALALDPTATEGWRFLASHLLADRASPEREADPVRRLEWLRAGVALLERGEASAADPAELCEQQGLWLGLAATRDPELPWPGGRPALWRAAAECFERAAARGSREARALAAQARAHAAADRE